MNTIPTLVGSTLPVLRAPAPAATEQPIADRVTLAPATATVAQPQSLSTAAVPADEPAPPEDKDWGTGARVAAIAVGVVGGAVLTGVVASLCGVGGMRLGGLVMNSLYREQLPKAIGLVGLASTTNSFLLAAPVLGAVAGGVVGGIAGKKKPVEAQSNVPGSALATHKPAAAESGLSTLGALGRVALHEFRGAGEKMHDGVNGVGDAKSFMGAVDSGAKGAYAFGSRMGQVGGRLVGIVQGAYLGTLLAGMPFAFAPLTAIPVAIVGAWGISEAMSKAGGIAAGTVAGAGGAVLGGVAYGVKKAVGH